MKFLRILIIFKSYLLVNCAGLKCYHASNIDSFPNSTIKDCEKPYDAFCATAAFRNGEVPGFTCGDDEFCYSKSCADSIYCTKRGTWKHDYPGLSNVKYTLTCCDTDLCNVESSAKTLYRTSFNFVFYISKFYYLYFVTVWYLFC